MTDKPAPPERWVCARCGTERRGHIDTVYLDRQFADARCNLCRRTTLHRRVR